MEKEDAQESSSNSSNSLLTQLKSKLKGGLKPTTTKTTFPDGSIQFTTCQGTTCEPYATSKEVKGFGFVVDEKPDLKVGRIRPWLFVSSQDVPNDVSLLKEHGITHILSLLPGFILSTEAASVIESHSILDMYDEESFELDNNLCQTAFDFIDEAKNIDGKAVLLHCNAGISRAPSVALAYLMKRENLSLDKAWENVKLARPAMRPNAGFLKQLQRLD